MVSQNTNAKSSDSSNKITSYFTPKNESSGQHIPSTKCPLCNCPATIREVNKHLDTGCPNQVTNDESISNNSISNSTKEIDNDEISLQNIHCDTTSNNASCSSQLKNTAKDVTKNPEINNTTRIHKASEEGNVTYLATKSVSDSPLKINNLSRITKLSDENSKSTTILLSPIKSPNKRHYPSPTKQPQKVMKQLFHTTPDKANAEKQDFEHIPLTPSKKQDPLHVPYYLTNFETVLRGVLEETDDGELFLPQEKEYVIQFRTLSLQERKLYVRLFQRKHTWLQVNKIRYDEISNVEDVANNLVKHGLLINNSGLEDDLETVLDLLSAGSLKILCKELNFGVEGTKQKSDHIEAIRKHLKRKQTCVFSQSGSEKFKTNICHKANKLLGLCYKLESEPRKIFLRVLSLYSLSDWWEERENSRGGASPTLTTILLKNTGRLVYPLYKITRQTKIFPTRLHLLRFEEACTLESDFVEACENNCYERAVQCGKVAEEYFTKALDLPDYTKHALSLPLFLRKFTPGSILAYVLSQTVDINEKLKDHENAVIILRRLIAQDIYLPNYHGHWYERLCLDLHLHLKMSKEALKEAGRAFNDPFVRPARRLSICKRIKYICNAKKNKMIRQHYGEETLEAIENMYPQNFDEVIIQGRMMPKAPNHDRTGLQGGKSIFVFGDKRQGEQLLCSVEEFVKETYRSKGYPHGLHAEGSVVNTIFTILFWDIIYQDDLPDVFRTPHQAVPLDFDTDDFYKSRKDLIDKRIEDIRAWRFETLSEIVTDVWNRWANSVNSCPANWDLFPSGVEQFLGLLKCFDSYQLSGICERLAKDHRHSRSGFPDLTVWNPLEDSKTVAFIEVKGPSDILSSKQILWLNYLQSLGIKAFVCHVEAMNAKNLSSPKKIKQTQCSSYNDSPPSRDKDSSVKKLPTVIEEKCAENMTTNIYEGTSNDLKSNRKRKRSGRNPLAKKKPPKSMNNSTDIVSQEELESIFSLD